MESVTILNAIGQIDDEMIESAAIQVPQRKIAIYKLTALRTAAAIAACLALVIGLLLAISGLRSMDAHGGPDGPVIGTVGTQGSEPTQGTDTSRGTEPTQGNDNTNFGTGDSVTVEPMPPYAMSCEMPGEYGTEDGYIPITISFGLLEGIEMDQADFDCYPEILLRAGDNKGQTIVLDRINTEDITKPEYAVEMVWDENQMWFDFIYSHTETVNLPLTLFTEDSGRICISITEYSSDGDRGSGAYVVLDYTRADNKITFSIAVNSP